MVATREKLSRHPSSKREELRERLWPNGGELVWSRKTNDGFITIPRLLPLVIHLIKQLAPKGDPGRAYLDLWSRSFDEGIISINDEADCAYSSGYIGNRAVRTWREHILALQELGLISVRPRGNREIGHILLLDPIKVCAKLHKQAKSKVPSEWWAAFVERANEIGALLPELETPHTDEFASPA